MNRQINVRHVVGVALALGVGGSLLLGLAGCVRRTVVVEAKPPGATVFIDDVNVGEAPVAQTLTWHHDTVHTIAATADKHERDAKPLTYGEAKQEKSPWNIELEPKALAEVVQVKIQTVPAGATIRVGEQPVGRAPLVVPIEYVRATSETQWSTAHIEATLADYAPSSADLSYEAASAGTLVLPALDRIKAETAVHIRSNVEAADVLVDGELIGQTPLTMTADFARRDGDAQWNTHAIEVRKEGYRWERPGQVAPPGDTRPFVVTLTYALAQEGAVDAELQPVRYYWTPLPEYKFDACGMHLVEELVLSQVGDTELEPLVQSVTRMTDRDFGEMVNTRLWIATAAQELVYSLPINRQGDATGFANLWRQDGLAMTRLTDGPYVDIEASVTADGKYVYFSSNRLCPKKYNVWRAESVGQGGFMKVTDSPTSKCDIEPMASPDGTRIVYTSFLQGVDPPQIWMANADGTLPTQLRVGRSPTWSPDGRQILYVTQDDKGVRQIWVMNADGSSPTQLSFGEYEHEHPVWTPDGERVVYASNEGMNGDGVRNYDIWIMDKTGTDRTQLTVNGSCDKRPAVSPDGKYIYFLSNRGAKRQLDRDCWQIWRIELK